MDKAAKITADQPGVFILQVSYDSRLWEAIDQLPASDRLWLAPRDVWRIGTIHREALIQVLFDLDYLVYDDLHALVIDGVLVGLGEPTPLIVKARSHWMVASPREGHHSPDHALCPVCPNDRGIICHTSYTPADGSLRLQFYSALCGHMWELCFRTHQERLCCWTSVLPVFGPDQGDDVPRSCLGYTVPEEQRFAEAMIAELERHRGQMVVLDFEQWFQQAMEADEDRVLPTGTLDFSFLIR